MYPARWRQVVGLKLIKPRNTLNPPIRDDQCGFSRRAPGSVGTLIPVGNGLDPFVPPLRRIVRRVSIRCVDP
jgi:hypothetical protein